MPRLWVVSMAPMHRLLVALLSAFDAFVVAAVGVVVVLAPATLLWAVGMGGADWSALWPATASIWLLGHLVPLGVHLPAEYLTAAGIPDGAAAFTVSLAPLAFAAFAVWGAARSGARAGRSGVPWTGVASGTVVFTAIAALLWTTGRNPVVHAVAWQAIVIPGLVFAVPAAAGAVTTAWHLDRGVIGGVREALGDLPGRWPELPALAVRGAAIVLTALLGLGAVAVVVALVARGDQVVALYQAGNLDALGVIVVSLAQLLYLPTLVVWGLSFVAGPGFSVGVGTAVSPAGTQVGVVPGVPALGLLPESTSPWLLVLVLLPVAAGALAGWAVRAQLSPAAGRGDEAGWVERASAAVGIALLSAGGAALLSWAAAGALGPGRLAQVGPAPGPVALAVGLEVLVGAGILLLGPLPHSVRMDPAASMPARAWASTPLSEDETDTVPIDPGFLGDRP